MGQNINIPARMHCVEEGNVLTGANEILDDELGKKQSVINAEVNKRIGNKPATTGTTGAYPSNGMGRVYLPNNEVAFFPSNTWVMIVRNNIAYLVYSYNFKYYAVYDSVSGKGLVLENNLVTELAASDYNIADIADIVGENYIGYTEDSGVYTITKPDDTTITSTEINNTHIWFWNQDEKDVYNVLTQDMFYKGPAGSRVPNTDTIFVIQYDYNLGGESITIPENCVLEFDGGSLRNGTINYNGCYISGEPIIHCIATGMVSNTTAYSDWFGADKTGARDSSTELNNFFACGAGNLIVSAGTYKISHTINQIKPRSNINCSWCRFILDEGITGFEFPWTGEQSIKYDITFSNFRIECSGNNTCIKIAANYFIYFYDFDIRFGTDGNIGILQENNFNCSFRDGRIYGILTDTQAGVLDTTNVGIKLTTLDDVSYNTQVSNLTFDNILIQHCHTGVLIDYPASVAQDEINFLNMGITYSGIGYHYKSGYTNSMILGSRVTTCVQAFKVDMVRSLTIQDCYGIQSGFLDAKIGTVTITGTNDFFLTGSAQLKDRKRLLKVGYDDNDELLINTNTGLPYVIIYWRGSLSSYGYTLPNLVADNSIVMNNVRGGEEVFTMGGLYPDLTNCKTIIKNRNGAKVGELVQNYLYLPTRTVPLYNSSFTVQDPFSNYIVQNDIASIKGNYINKIIRITTNSDKPVYVQLYDQIIILTKYDCAFVKCDAVDQWSLYAMSKAHDAIAASTADRPRSVIGEMVIDTDLHKPIWAFNNTWIDATGVLAGTPTSGAFADKPTTGTHGIPVGFAYFCTDKQTTEGATDGIVIYHKGSNVWVDALGRTVS